MLSIPFPLYTDVSLVYISARTSALNACLLHETTYSTAHWHVRSHLFAPATTLVHIPIGSHLSNCSGFLISPLVSTLVPPQSVLKIVDRMILFYSWKSYPAYP